MTLIEAAGAGDVEQVRVLLEQGADVRARENDGLHALDAAAEAGYPDVVEALLTHDGALVDLPGYFERTALVAAIIAGHTGIVAQLLTRGADPRRPIEGVGRPLEQAAQEGYAEIVELLLAHDPGLLDLPGAYGRTALAAASSGGHTALVELLLARGADTRANLSGGASPLHWAAMQGHEAVVERLLAHDPQLVDLSGDEEGCAALQLAASQGHTETVRSLLAHGADPRKRAGNGTRALDQAAQKGRQAVVECLLAHDPELLELPGYLERTALAAAAGNGHEPLVELLLARGANARARLSDGRRALDWAAHGGHVQVLKLLLAHDPEMVNLQGYHARTALAVASGSGQLEAVDLLLSLGADPRHRVDGGARALDWAAGRGYVQVMERLLAHDRELLELPGEAEHTPLMEAAGYGYAAAVRLLLAHGADPACRVADGERALDWAAQEGHIEVVQCLLEHDPGLVELPGYRQRTALIAAAGNGHLEMAKLLVAHGAQVTQQLADGSHALDWAAQKGDEGLVEFLLGQAPQMLDAPGYQQRTPLAVAAGAGHSRVVEFLLSRGADPRRSLPDGTRALDWAAWGGHRAVVELLLAHDPQLLDLPGERERTALGAAAARGHTELALMLLERGADMDKVNANGISPLEWAAHNGHWETLERMLAHHPQPDAPCRALLAASFGGQEHVVRALLARGADPRQRRADGANSLDLASAMGHLAVVKALLEFDNTLVSSR